VRGDVRIVKYTKYEVYLKSPKILTSYHFDFPGEKLEMTNL
jgi:hypothetical protein